MNDIKEIIAIPLPFGLDEKIFYITDEDGNQIGEPYSNNDWIQQIIEISGVNEDLSGPSQRIRINNGCLR